jgi:hypothetical protein
MENPEKGPTQSALDRLDAELKARFRADQSAYLKVANEIIHSELCALFMELKARFVRYRQESFKYEPSFQPTPAIGTHVKIKCLELDSFWDFVLVQTADRTGKRVFLDVEAEGQKVKLPGMETTAPVWAVTDIPVIEDQIRSLVQKYFELLLPRILPGKPGEGAVG